MPTRSEIETERERKRAAALEQADQVLLCSRQRNGYLQKLCDFTGRDVILYAGNRTDDAQGAVVEADIQGFMSALYQMKNKKLDLIIHSDGGDPYAAEQIGNYLREKYAHIRAIIPQKAMSAATMMACACDEIIMGKHSAISPIDPQIIIPKWGHNFGYIAAQFILDEFERAYLETSKDANKAAIWYPKIEYPPGFLTQLRNMIDRSEIQVKDWLKERMLKGNEKKAEKVAEWLAKGDHKDHGRPIPKKLAKEKGLKIVNLEDDQELQDHVLAVFYAMTSTFEACGCVKIIENQHNEGYWLYPE